MIADFRHYQRASWLFRLDGGLHFKGKAARLASENGDSTVHWEEKIFFDAYSVLL